MSIALITGVAGQDGSYLAELLLDKGYDVHGVVRPEHACSDRIAHLLPRLHVHAMDLFDGSAVLQLIDALRPAEVYHLAAQSFVPASWDGTRTQALVGAGLEHLLAAVTATCPDARFFHASSSEIFGTPALQPQDEGTPIRPRSPYGVAKSHGHAATALAREQRGLFAVNGILYNHESPRRAPRFVTRKVTRGVARIALGLDEELVLGDLDAERDWGFAGDTVRGMWTMLQRDRPEDYVLGTGTLRSVRDLVAIAFAGAGLDWERYTRSDPSLLRPRDGSGLVADPSKARRDLGWEPALDFPALVGAMVDADLARERGAAA